MLLSLPAAVLAAGAVWVNSAANRQWVRMEVGVRALHAEILARDPGRPVLQGTPTEGNAWDDYGQALAAVGAAGPTDRFSTVHAFDYLRSTSRADRSKVAAGVAGNLAALDLLRRGAVRGQALMPAHWESGYPARILELTFQDRLVALARCRARLLAEDGDPEAAVEVLLALAQFGRDLGAESAPISNTVALSVLDLCQGDLRDLLVAGRISPVLGARLAKSLDTLDASFPRYGASLLNGALRLGFEFLKPDGPGKGVGMDFRGSFEARVRHGFSLRILQAEAFESSVRWARQMGAAEALSYPEQRRVEVEVNEDRARRANPIVDVFVSHGSPSLWSRTKLSLLRAAARHIAKGVEPEVDDPCGTKLRFSKIGDGYKIWSVGPNGVDDGGQGAWGRGPDIVLEIKR